MIVKKVNSQKEKEDAFFVRTTVFVEEQKVPIDIELDSYDKSAIHFVGYVNNQPMAAARVRFAEDYGKLERICVLQSFRGNHFGERIVSEMEKEIQEHGYDKAKLHAQTHAKSFYEQLGYQITSEEFMDAGIPHVAMMKKL